MQVLLSRHWLGSAMQRATNLRDHELLAQHHVFGDKAGTTTGQV